MSNGGEQRQPLSLGTRILIGLAAGIAFGLFVGDLARPLKAVGDVFVGLLQMTVLPFIVCSVIGNIGRLTIDQSKKLAACSLVVLFALWGVGLAAVFLMAQALPQVPDQWAVKAPEPSLCRV